MISIEYLILVTLYAAMIWVELVTGQLVTSAEPELLKRPQVGCHIQRLLSKQSEIDPEAM